MSASRRQFLRNGAALSLLALSGCQRHSEFPTITGRILGPPIPKGHHLQKGIAQSPSNFKGVDVLIVGGGISGLCAGWYLKKKGVENFKILELADKVGGNAQSGANAISAYPWGAHYIPAPPPEAEYTHALFRELGIEIGRNADGLAQYHEDYRCYAPESRIFYRGRWYPGLYLRAGASSEDLQQWKHFEDLIAAWKYRRGSDGKRAFTIPMALSSQDPAFLALDSLRFSDFLDEKGLNSSRLRWVVDYAMRDDYAARAQDVSAWAGLHYFCSRITHPDPKLDEEPVTLTWPEGNGFLVRALADKQADHLHMQRLVYDIHPESEGEIRVSALNLETDQVEGYQAKAVIFAAPAFLANHLIRPLKKKPRGAVSGVDYGPWLVANLTVSERLRGHGAPPAWDNVLYHGKGVGYVAATHQAAKYRGPAVLTYYYPLTAEAPKAARERLLKTPWQAWVDFIIKDLRPAHPDLQKHLQHVDIMRWGHAMIRPKPGHLWGGPRAALGQSIGAIHFAHADLGLPLFEEAQYFGVEAAKSCLKTLGNRP